MDSQSRNMRATFTNDDVPTPTYISSPAKQLQSSTCAVKHDNSSCSTLSCRAACLRGLLLLRVLAIPIGTLLLARPLAITIDQQILLAPLKAHHCLTSRDLQVAALANHASHWLRLFQNTSLLHVFSQMHTGTQVMQTCNSSDVGAARTTALIAFQHRAYLSICHA